MVGDAKFKLGNAYGWALILESFMLFMSFFALRHELLMGEWCAAFACGLQNALATSCTGVSFDFCHLFIIFELCDLILILLSCR
jgi:hypothetical protein